jgi:uncharacterized lipoprotein
MKSYLKNLLLYASIVLLAACSSQEGANNDVAVVNNATDATKTVATQATETTTVGTSPKRDLLEFCPVV